MKKFKLLLTCILVGIVVALLYYAFEYAVRNSIDYVWGSLGNSGTNRFMVVVLCVVLSVLFFGLQHLLDPESETHEKHGLGGGVMSPTLKMLLIILLLGFFSLLAGASLGPEAVLVPASMVAGSLIGVKLFKKETESVKALAAAAIMALMAAFFHSFIIGVLSVLLVKKQANVKISPALLVIAVIASLSSYLTLQVIDPAHRYFNFPPLSLKVAVVDLLAGVILAAAGYGATFALKYGHSAGRRVRAKLKPRQWWQLAILASVGLSMLYLIGGPLVEFTGNQSIAPMLGNAGSLGFLGLLGVCVFKLLAIAWSKAMGYRGGLIFPMIFVASTLVAFVQLLFKDASFGVGLIAAMAGILLAEKKAQILL